jgi:signal peptidase I
MKNVCIFLMLLLLSACYKEIDLEDYRTSPKVVLNCAISTDTIIMASVSRTWFFTDNSSDVVISDAKVELFVNDVFRESMVWQKGNTSNGVYVSNIIPVEGDRIKIVATTNYGKVWAEDEIPVKVMIRNVEISARHFGSGTHIIVDKDGNIIEKGDNLEIKYQISFDDKHNTNDFYFLRIENCDKLQSLGTLDYASDPIFLADESAINTSLGGQTLPGQGGRTFTDKSINGQSYTLTVTESGSSYLYDYGAVLNRKISLYSLSKPYYQYLTSILKTNEDNAMQKLSDFGLAEPIRIFSNIQGGTGIIGASQNDSKTIDLRKILPDHM